MDKRIKSIAIYTFIVFLLINVMVTCILIEKQVTITKEKETIERELNNLTKEYNKLNNKNTNNPEELIKITCEEYNVDYILAISIARAETGNFTSKLYKESYNIGGLRNDENWYEYNNLVEGVNAYISMLKTEYIDKGLNTPEKMQPKYCPGEDGQKWITLVCEIMEEENERM